MRQLLGIFLMFFSYQAFADQCAWNDRAAADRARNFVIAMADADKAEHQFILFYCDHCDRYEPNKAYKFDLNKAGPTGATHERSDPYQVKVERIKSDFKDKQFYGLRTFTPDGEPMGDTIDLAYAYVKVAPGIFASLAYVSDCTLGVDEPPFIYATNWSAASRKGIQEFEIRTTPQSLQ
jgi:hypothetical protein